MADVEIGYVNAETEGRGCLKTVAAWSCVVGGMLWGLKPLYDWLVLGRRANTGYIASDFTDWIKFLFPFFCLGGLYVLFALYKGKVRKSVVILAAALVFNGLFHFFEIYFTGSGIPFGLLFLFSGTLLLLAGAGSLMIQLRGSQEIPRALARSAEALFTVTLLFCLLPFLSGSLPERILTPVMVLLMLLTGFIWAAMGAVLAGIVRKEASVKLGKSEV